MERIVCEKHNVLLTGEESYPIVGNTLSKDDCGWAMKMFAVMRWKRHWNCLEKAKMVADYLGKREITLGELTVWSGDWKSTYGFKFNPPYEFHAWVQHGESIIDLALPGVIELGSSTGDTDGPYLIGREPIIIASEEVPEWIKYKRIKYLPI